MLDNASEDGSAEAARAHPAVDEVIALERRRGKAANDCALLRARARPLRAPAQRGLRAAARRAAALHAALEADPRAGAAGARLLRPDGAQQASAWRFPTVRTARGRRGAPAPPQRAVDRRRRRARSTGPSRPRCSSAARRPSRSGGSTSGSSSTPTRSTSPSACATPAGGRSTCRTPSPSTTSSSRPAACPSGASSSSAATATSTCASTTAPRAARAVRWLTALPYALRALAALVLPGHDPRRYARHVTATLRPGRGEGIREAAEAFNAARDAAAPPRPPAPPQSGSA